MSAEVNMSNGTVMEISPTSRRKAGEGRKSKQAAKEGGDITIRHTKRLLITGPKAGLAKRLWHEPLPFVRHKTTWRLLSLTSILKNHS
jgi:hypothetical protein